MIELIQENKGCVLTCNEQGLILEVLSDELGVFKEKPLPVPFSGVLDSGSKEKAEAFLAEIKREGASFDWELNIFTKGEITRLFFSGIVRNNQYLIFGILSSKGVDKVYEELFKINTEQNIALRAALKYSSTQLKPEQEKKIVNYEHFTSLNNELVTLQRELTKKNSELNKYQLRVQEELAKARNLHLRAFPNVLPQPAGYSIAGFYQPTTQLGGDFFDVLELKDKILFYLTDVTGHGIDGAMLTAFIKESIHSYLALVPQELITPSSIVQHLMERFRAEGYPDDYFLCIYLGMLDLRTHQISYISMGMQCPPLMLDQENISPLPTGGLPISNAIPKELVLIEEYSCQVPPRCNIIFTTDGIWEHTIHTESYEPRLLELLQRSSGLEATGIISAILDDFKLFNTKNQNDDDITLLIVKRK